jgi:DNA polymerase-3 subunit delta'
LILPWQTSDWNRLTSNTDRLHHGILIHARSGTGMREFVFALAQFFICENQDQTTRSACQVCQNCRLFLAGSHPDFHAVTSEFETVTGRISLLSAYSNRYQDAKEREKKSKPSRVISVEQVRKLISRFSTHTHIASTRVALIMPADRLNINAANALLKLLEEPPDQSILILATSQTARLPKTILSRCVLFPLAAPNREQSLHWLEEYIPEELRIPALDLSNNEPLNARVMVEAKQLEDRQNYLEGLISTLENRIYPLDLAAKVAKMEFDNVLLWFAQFVRELVVWKAVGQKPLWGDTGPVDPARISLDRLYALYDRINHYRKISRGSVNEQLAMEDLLISLQKVAQ